MKRLSPADFATVARARPPQGVAVTRLATGADLFASTDDFTAKFVLSDSSVARDGHIIKTSGWDLSAFKSNPVAPFAHDSSALPIGKWSDVKISGDQLVGTLNFPKPGVYDFADTVRELLKNGFLNAVSVSWNPLEWKWSTDRSRPGGIDFLRQELLEASVVPVPALPTALVTARSRGIDTSPLYRWAERALDRSPDLVPLPRRQVEAIRIAAKMPSPARPRDTAAERLARLNSIRARIAGWPTLPERRRRLAEIQARVKALVDA